MTTGLPFTPSPDVAVVVHALLDVYERRAGRRPVSRAVRVGLGDIELPGYGSQLDPAARLTANEQLRELAARHLVHLTWSHGQEDHLLEIVTLVPDNAPALFAWLGRAPLAAQRTGLRDRLLAERWRFGEGDWRRRALDHTLSQLRADASPLPFVVGDDGFNHDLLTALVALDTIAEEIPYRVFSVRTFNDSKVLDGLKGALATLARRHQPEWASLTPEEALRELGLVANPVPIFLAGPWWLRDRQGRLVDLSLFAPAVGIPTQQAVGAGAVGVDSSQVRRVVCVENPAAFYELVRHAGDGLAALCLWGNPAPPLRHLLRLLVETLPEAVPLTVWADLDGGGLNIVAMLRRLVSSRVLPYHMDVPTLLAHARWAKPLTANDRVRLLRLRGQPVLADLRPLIETMLEQGIKLEQEAIRLEV